MSGGTLNLHLAGANSGAVVTSNPNLVTPGFHFTYGYIEFKATFPNNNAWTAGWTLSDTCSYTGGDWTGGEFDIAESLGDWLSLGNYHWGHPEQTLNGLSVGTAPLGSPHVYGMYWQPGRADFYIDGTLDYSITANVVGAPQYLIFNIGNSTPGDTGPVGSQVTVNYVRVWALPPGASETVAVTDAATGNLTHVVRAATDTALAGDSAAGNLTLVVRAATDAAHATDAATGNLTHVVRATTDTAHATDAATGNLTHVVRAATDTAHATDAATGNLTHVVGAETDTAHPTDAATGNLTRATTDTGLAGDSAAGNLTLVVRAATDAALASDSPARAAFLHRSATDTALGMTLPCVPCSCLCEALRIPLWPRTR